MTGTAPVAEPERGLRAPNGLADRPKRVAVLGGGITGLAAAHRAHELGAEVVLLEASERLGGVIATEHQDGWVLELGPDSFVTDKPQAAELSRRMGLGDALLPTNDRFRRTLVVHDGRLEALPGAFQLLAPARLLPFLATPILSPLGKLAALRDLVAPRGGPPPGGDESLASFVRRRLGSEVLDRIAQPMVGGIYTADPERLSLAATMPRFIELERRHRSLILGLMRNAAATPSGTSGARFGLFVTLRDGLESLVDALARSLPKGAVRTGARVVSVRRSGGRWTIEVEGGAPETADAIVVALPAPRAAVVLREESDALAGELAGIPYASSAIVLLGWRRADVPHPLDAFGLVVPEVERRRIIAASFSSVKYDGRAPDDHVLVRVFLGGAMHPEAVAADDASMLAAARAELKDLLGITAEPVLARVGRWPESMPQYHVGHQGRVARIRALERGLPGLALAGNAYDGVGLSDCVRSAEAAVAAVLAEAPDAPSMLAEARSA
ncbi:MAG: protoporphyrinogen oxidase [Alphaproteobacteria bacterium]